MRFHGAFQNTERYQLFRAKIKPPGILKFCYTILNSLNRSVTHYVPYPIYYPLIKTYCVLFILYEKIIPFIYIITPETGQYRGRNNTSELKMFLETAILCANKLVAWFFTQFLTVWIRYINANYTIRRFYSAKKCIFRVCLCSFSITYRIHAKEAKSTCIHRTLMSNIYLRTKHLNNQILWFLSLIIVMCMI